MQVELAMDNTATLVGNMGKAAIPHSWRGALLRRGGMPEQMISHGGSG